MIVGCLGLTAISLVTIHSFYLKKSNQKLANKIDAIEQKLLDDQPPSETETWFSYNFKPIGGKYGFSIYIPDGYELLENKAQTTLEESHFAIFSTKTNRDIAKAPVMTVIFSNNTGAINFASVQDSRWDKYYHNRVVKSFQPEELKK